MKKLLVLLSAVSLFICSCEKGHLDTEPGDRYVETNFWTSEQAAKAGLTGCYAVLRYAGLYGGMATPLLEETATPNAYAITNTDNWNTIAAGNHSATTSGVIPNRWNGNYAGIGRCNTLLAKIDNVQMADDLKIKMKGEAYFLRALYYFNLQTYFGDVPLILDAPDAESQADLPRTPRVQVVQQIIKDLDMAAEILPYKYAQADVGRATKGAALALKAKVLTFEASALFNENGDVNKWKTAADAAKTLIDMKGETGYDLFENYRNLFLPAFENNKEVIFDVQYIFPLGGNSFDVVNRQYNYNAPILGIAEAYQMKSGLPISDPASGYNPATPYANRDPRLYSSIVFPGDTYMGITVTNSRFAFTGFGLEKYGIYTEAAPASGTATLSDNQSGTNYIVLRYADILLLYAEAQNEFAGPDESVHAAVNQVRRRAGMPELSKTLDKDGMRTAIRQERRVEFAGEGYYYNDIRRWKTAEVVLNASIFTYDNKVLETRKFNASRDYWWPIPEQQMNLNPNLVQNKNY